MPLGLPALCWRLTRAGSSSQIMHLTVEELLDPDFVIPKAKFIALDLHWHPQTYRVIETARLIKQSLPEVKILLGGFTASLFANEIMTGFPEIDFIIKGDAEVPLVELCQGRALKDIPNLVWREGGKVRENPRNYVIDQNTFDELEYFHLDLISHHEVYDRIYDYENRLSKTPIEKILKGRS